MKKLYSYLTAFVLIWFFFSGSQSMAQCDPLELGNDTFLCEGGALILDAGPALEYNWMKGASNEQTFSVTEPDRKSTRLNSSHYS